MSAPRLMVFIVLQIILLFPTDIAGTVMLPLGVILRESFLVVRIV